MNEAQKLDVAVSIARGVIAHEGGGINYYVPPDHILVDWGITEIDGTPVVVDEDIPVPITGR